MNFIVNGYNVFIIILTTFLTSLILTHLMIKISKNMNIMDIPNERSVHKKPTPLLGGIAIFLSFLFGFILFGNQNPLMISILIASFLILLLGIFDDIKPIKARYKFVIHILVALIVVFYGGLKLTHVDIFGLSLNFKWMSPYITILIIVGIINAVNLIDGLDGLCAGISSIYFLTIGVIALILNKFNGLDIILSFIMLGATLGFLVFNSYPARVFMGDTGSLALGAALATIAILTRHEISLILIGGVFVVETLSSLIQIIAIRKFHKKVFKKAPLHHHFEELGWEEIDIVKLFWTIGFLLSMIGVIYGVWL